MEHPLGNIRYESFKGTVEVRMASPGCAAQRRERLTESGFVRKLLPFCSPEHGQKRIQ